LFDGSLAKEDIFYYNSAFAELQNRKAGQISVVCFKNKMFELQKQLRSPCNKNTPMATEAEEMTAKRSHALNDSRTKAALT